MRSKRFLPTLALMGLLLPVLAPTGVALPQRVASADTNCTTFQETGRTVCGRFLQYWNEHGGLAQQGYPITDAIGEVSDVDGQLRTVQYFERSEFEYHVQNAVPNDVLLALLGS
ncbi:MAG TPA: vanomycin resistance protein VanB, partial [Chloroflexia bacterium]|nr:vanomycin resistance protein VanB [Chloroflexia bacterium]